jgi:hypothetical protein
MSRSSKSTSQKSQSPLHAFAVALGRRRFASMTPQQVRELAYKGVAGKARKKLERALAAAEK